MEPPAAFSQMRRDAIPADKIHTVEQEDAVAVTGLTPGLQPVGIRAPQRRVPRQLGRRFPRGVAEDTPAVGNDDL